METSVFLKKLIFALTTGSILVYLISFHSVGQTKSELIQRKKCQSELIKIRSGKPVPLKYQHEVLPTNVLSLTTLEQKMLTHYMKNTKHSLIENGVENPFFLTTYRMESSTRSLLGYKIVVDTVIEDDDVMTFYLTNNQNMLFWYLDSKSPKQEWKCQI